MLFLMIVFLCCADPGEIWFSNSHGHSIQDDQQGVCNCSCNF